MKTTTTSNLKWITQVCALTLAVPAFANPTTSPVPPPPPPAGVENVTVGVQNVFVPQQGYDDNDSVELVVDGELPNTCYSVERTSVTVDPKDAFTLMVKQSAVRNRDGICTEGNSDFPVHMQMTVPYTTDVNVGRLAAGNYKVVFTTQDDKITTQSFTVGKAPVRTVDSLPYARVSNAGIADLVPQTQDVSITLNGTLSSSCQHLDKTVTIKRVNDVIIVLPTIKVDLGPLCLQTVRNFSTTVDLGKLPSGRYLAHVRSQNGKAVNRVFSVVEKIEE